MHGQRPTPAAARITRAESRQLPGALGDPFRAIEALPGVTPVASGLPYFFVRGAPPGNVGYFFDGIRLPLLFHVFFGPSVLHPSMIQKVDLYRGGYPARVRAIRGSGGRGRSRAAPFPMARRSNGSPLRCRRARGGAFRRRRGKRDDRRSLFVHRSDHLGAQQGQPRLLGLPGARHLRSWSARSRERSRLWIARSLRSRRRQRAR